MTALVDTYAMFPLDVVSGIGGRVYTRDGRALWDFYGGHAVALLGHSHPAITRAVAEQCATLTFYSNVVPLDIRTRAAERLCAFAGMPHVFFCNSGAEANENALKLALRATGRRRIAAVEGGWHGRSLLCLAATTDDKLTQPVRDMLVDCVRVPPNVTDALSGIDERVAAVLVEPILSIGGVVELTADYLLALRARCDAVGAMLIYDEVQTGMGRLGRPYVAGWEGVWPDMVTSAKGLGNGIPVGALLMSAGIGAALRQGDLGSTFGGGPVASAAVCATIQAIEDENAVANAALLGARMHAALKVGPVTGVLGRGCLIGLHVRGAAKRVQSELMEAGFVTGTSARPDVLRLMPPINLPLSAVDELAAALARVRSA